MDIGYGIKYKIVRLKIISISFYRFDKSFFISIILDESILQVEIAESDDYKYVVTCIDAEMVFMNEDAVEVVCNTSTGSYYTRIDLSPCLRVIEQINPQ